MKFEQLSYLPWVVIGILSLLVSIYVLERKFFKMIKLYWFYGRSLFSYLSSFFFLTGMAALLLSLLDLRGPEERIKSGVPTERTIILIDTSASMLAEDVKPSRLQKAVLIAKHYARKAAGQQMAIVVFAEIQKKIVPFTNDLDLIDARLESIKNLRNQSGSSAMSLAIQESIQYFKETGDSGGNILVLTDGEETVEDIKLEIPKDIHIALVGVGTTQGGRIPIDDGRGIRFGYKKDKGKDVITKFNEKFFKKIVADIPSGEYWHANSYSLPTDEILEFFNKQKKKSEKQQEMNIRPVMMEWIVVPGLILLILSYSFKAIKIFSLGLIIVLMPVWAEEKIELTPEIESKMDLLQKGELSRVEKVKLADELYKAGAKSDALTLFEENLYSGDKNSQIPPEAYLNYGTGMLEKGEVQKGLSVYDQLLKSLDPKSQKHREMKDLVSKNVMNFFKVQEKKEKDKKDKDQKNGEKKEKEKGEESNQKSEDGDGDALKEQQSNAGDSDQKKSAKESKKDKNNPLKNNEQKDPNNGDKKDQQDKKQEEDQAQDKDQGEEKKGEGEKSEAQGEKKKLPLQKVSPKLKQLMSDDRQLQLKIIEQATRDMNRRKNRENKDW